MTLSGASDPSELFRLRRLAGAPAHSLFFFELLVPSTGLVLPAETGRGRFNIVFALRSDLAVAAGPASSEPLLMREQQLTLLAPARTWHLSPAGRAPAEVLVWRFALEHVPKGLRRALPIPQRGYRGPLPISSDLRNVVIGVRSCPVLETLRDYWAAAKLAEALALIGPADLPASATTPSAQSGDPRSATPNRRWHPAVVRALDYMERHLSEPIDLPGLARAAGASPAHLSRLFTRELGEGPSHYLRRLRLDRAAALLRVGQANVTEAALAVGYASLGQFSRAFLAHHGVPPSALRRPAASVPAVRGVAADNSTQILRNKR
jgi:AraC-like DNA-binding protein